MGILILALAGAIAFMAFLMFLRRLAGRTKSPAPAKIARREERKTRVGSRSTGTAESKTGLDYLMKHPEHPASPRNLFNPANPNSPLNPLNPQNPNSLANPRNRRP